MMIINAIMASLPNGFHDCYMGKISTDFVNKTVSLQVDLLVGDDDSSEQYKTHLLSFAQVALLHFEPPVNYRNIGRARGLAMDGVTLNEVDKRTFKEEGYVIPNDNFWCAFFVYEWNSRLIINASSCELRPL